MQYLNDTIKKLVETIRKNALMFVFLLMLILGVFLGVNAFIAHKQTERKVVFTKQIILVNDLLTANKPQAAQKIITELKKTHQDQHSLSLLRYLECRCGKITSEIEKYIPSSVEYGDASIFGDIAWDHYFLKLIQQKQYLKIRSLYLTKTFQDHQDLVPFLAYMHSLYYTQNKDIAPTVLIKLYTSNGDMSELVRDYFESLIWGKN